MPIRIDEAMTRQIIGLSSQLATTRETAKDALKQLLKQVFALFFANFETKYKVQPIYQDIQQPLILHWSAEFEKQLCAFYETLCQDSPHLNPVKVVEKMTSEIEISLNTLFKDAINKTLTERLIEDLTGLDIPKRDKAMRYCYQLFAPAANNICHKFGGISDAQDARQDAAVDFLLKCRTIDDKKIEVLISYYGKILFSKLCLQTKNYKAYISVDLAENLPDTSIKFDIETFEDMEAKAQLKTKSFAAMEKISEKCRDILTKFSLKDMTYEQIAKDYNENAGLEEANRFKKQAYDCRKRLKQLLNIKSKKNSSIKI